MLLCLLNYLFIKFMAVVANWSGILSICHHEMEISFVPFSHLNLDIVIFHILLQVYIFLRHLKSDLDNGTLKHLETCTKYLVSGTFKFLRVQSLISISFKYQGLFQILLRYVGVKNAFQNNAPRE